MNTYILVYWPHVYIPVLPFALVNILQAPVPFIVGVHPDMLGSVETVSEDVSVSSEITYTSCTTAVPY
jgi:hypothetical protein